MMAGNPEIHVPSMVVNGDYRICIWSVILCGSCPVCFFLFVDGVPAVVRYQTNLLFFSWAVRSSTK
mgnify:CR=1 FL=1